MTDLYPPGISREDITLQRRGCYQVAGRWFVRKDADGWRWSDGYDKAVTGAPRRTAREAFRDLADWLERRPASDILKGWANL